MLADAAVDAVMGYVKEPGKFAPAKCSLLSYLKMSALGDLLNQSAKERRRRDRPADTAVELDHFAGKELGEDTSSSADERGDVVSLMIHRLFQSDQDRRLAALIVDGERSTRNFAEVLGIMDLPIAEQRKTVKQHKDRIKKVLQRRGREHYG